MANTVAITLLRHGLTTYNVDKRYLGWTDLPLSDRGRDELLQLKGCGDYPTGDYFISSDLERCKETVEILFPDKPYEVDDRFREFNFGEWDGKTYEQLKDVTAYREWLDDFESCAPPKGECFQVFKERIVLGWYSLLKKLESSSIQHIIVVSHGGPIRLLLSLYAPDKKNMWEWPVEFGSGYTLFFNRSYIKEGERCTSLQVVPLMGKESGCTVPIN